MNSHPYRLALVLALTTLVGFVGMMVTDGWWDTLFQIVAVVPLAFGAVAWRRARQTANRSL